MAAILTRAVAVAGLAVSGAVLSACVVGPNYAGPPTAAPRAAQAPAFVRAVEAGPVSAETPQGRWWAALGDARLNALVETALAAGPDIDAARARLRKSRALLRQDEANRLPTSSASALAARTKGLTGALGGGSSAPLDLYSLGFDATWELDLFGGERRAVEGARADAEAVDADLQAVRVSLAAEVAQAYVTLRADQARLALLTHDADLEAQLAGLARQRRAGGTADDLDVERFDGQALRARAALAPLQADIAEQLDRLAVLAGREPGTLDADLAAPAAVPAPPATVAVGDPAALLRRRPDVRAAERRLARNTAVIGQRTADLFPKVTLLGDIGFTSTDISRLLTSGGFLYAAAPILQWSPLDFGRVQARIAQARADRDEAVANYRKAVLGALQDAEDGLGRYGRARQSAVDLAGVAASANRAAALADLRLKGGVATTLDALDAERTRVQAQIDLQQAQAQVTLGYVALQKSLGLAWNPTGG